ncbi:MAG: transposase [Dehalococcoidia bacterium]|uniref:REP-associated tyrosine transposase n=1 Tax=Candidatus Amarobacter glycogenicus TaxID=3140699 RepID=UPI0031346AB6|nr:transposase [Dehalococcoidia bacterium]MBK6561202.1 transposase [Dehalococcoidia bacterium]MBK8558782.1 transposase [Dehalococcoidia bacterium]
MRFPKTIRLADKSQYADAERVFHLVFAAHPEVHAFTPQVRAALWESLMEQRTAGRVELFAACLMPDHLHLLVSPRNREILSFVRDWKSWTSRLARSAGHFGPIWQPGMWDRVCRDERDFDAVTEYIVRNPVAAGLVAADRDWPFTWCVWWEDPTGGPGSTPA